MQRKQRINKSVSKANLADKKKDAAYWRKRPYAERLAALEEIRREYHQWKYGGEPKMQKVVKIVRLNRDYNDSQ